MQVCSSQFNLFIYSIIPEISFDFISDLNPNTFCDIPFILVRSSQNYSQNHISIYLFLLDCFLNSLVDVSCICRIVYRNMTLLIFLFFTCRVRSKFFSLIEDDVSNIMVPEKNNIVRSILMTTCDIAAITKPWEVQRQVRL